MVGGLNRNAGALSPKYAASRRSLRVCEFLRFQPEAA
jgi:hypothetical protein